MNERFTNADLENLMARRTMPAVSIFVPTHPVSTHYQEDMLHLKNLLKEAEEQLEAQGMRTPDIRELLAPGHALLENTPFWQHQSEGLALFLAPDANYRFRLPRRFQPEAVVANRFHIKPLIPLLTNDGVFYILAVSQNHVRLLQGTKYTVDELDLDNVPHSLAEALRFDDPEQQLQYHAGGDAAGRAIYHGHGGGATDDEKEQIRRYFDKIDNGLRDFLQDSQAPLVFAGVDYLFPIYQSANKYAHLLQESVEGNPDDLRPEQLHTRAWTLVEPVFAQAQETALAQYYQLGGTGRTSARLDELLPGAHQGRIDTLFVREADQTWGTFNPDTQEVDIHDEETAKNQDLLDLAASYTLLRSGHVFVLPEAEMPDQERVAGVYRY